MSDVWPTRVLADVCQIRPSKSEARRYISGADLVSFVPMEDLGIGQKTLVPKQIRVLDEVFGSYTYFAEGDVLLAKITPCFENGKLGIAQGLSNGVGFGSSEYIVFRPGTLIDKEWLYYFLSCESFRQEGAKRMSGAVGHKRVSKEFIETHPIPLPPLGEQRRIVAILDEAFEGIGTAIANAEKNLANSRELFRSYLSSAFSEEKWEEKTVGEIAEHLLGKMLDKRKNCGKPQPYLRNLNVRWFEFNLDDVLQMPFEDHEHKRYTAIKGDVLICEGGYPGRAAIWEGETPFFFQKAIHRVRFQKEYHSKWFLYYLYLADISGKLREHFTGAGIQHFTGQSLHKFRIPVPPMGVVRTYVKDFDNLFEHTKSLESLYHQKLVRLAELRQAVLHKAFAGELTTRSVAAVREAAE